MTSKLLSHKIDWIACEKSISFKRLSSLLKITLMIMLKVTVGRKIYFNSAVTLKREWQGMKIFHNFMLSPLESAFFLFNIIFHYDETIAATAQKRRWKRGNSKCICSERSKNSFFMCGILSPKEFFLFTLSEPFDIEIEIKWKLKSH